TTRAVVRRSNKNVLIQAIDFKPEGDLVVSFAHTNELKKYGWKGANGNTSAAYLCGLLFAKKVQAKKIKKMIADIGMQTSVKQGTLYGAIKGIKDGGVDISIAPEIIPEEKRIKGKNSQNFDETKKKIGAL
ncbi:MAG: 50S ribosomal protein L18, partial [Nanoarchaeota archaeon]